MKQLLFFFKQLLLLRKIIIYILLTAIVTGLGVYFAANSSFIIKKVADRFAPDYNISYTRIHGNVFTGLEIEELAYKHDILAKHLTLKWNPNGLLNKKIIVNTLQIEKANVDAIKILISSFQGTESNESIESNNTAFFDFDLKIDHLSVTAEPFVEQNITLSDTALKVNHLEYSNGRLDADKIELKADSDLIDVGVNVKVKKNAIKGQVRLTPEQAFFELYGLPVRKEAVGDVIIDISGSEKDIIADLDTKMKQLLIGEKDAFNLDIDSLHSHVVYDTNSKRLTADSKVMLSTPYAKDIMVTNYLAMDDALSYGGEIEAKRITGVDEKFVKPLNDLKIAYQGNMQRIDANISALNLQGAFSSSDFKKAVLHLENKEALVLNEFFDLPTELNQTKADLTVDMPVDLDGNVSLTAYAKIDSDLLMMDANVSYQQNVQVKTLTRIPEDSPLYTYNKEIKWNRLSPISMDAELKEDQIEAQLTIGALSANVQYVPASKKIEGKITLGTLYADVTGIADEKITIDTKIDSVSSLKENINAIYTMKELPPVKGRADLSVEISELDNVDITLRSPEIRYQADRTTEYLINDISLTVHWEESKVVLKEYALTYQKQKLFATKPSVIELNEERISVAPLWVNNQMQVTGEYNIKEQKGTIEAKADKFQITHEIIDVQSRVDLKIALDGNKTSVNGAITLLDGYIQYDIDKKSFVSDSDIIIVQEMKEKKESTFMKNLSTSVQIKTQKPLVYKKGDIDIKMDADVNLYKAEGSELMVLGSVEIAEGGTYRFEGKKFELEKSYVHFTGKPDKPLIEASATYNALNYLITITVTGTADAPNIEFASKPALSREQILSIILFDSEGGAGTSSGEDMMKMMGGAMAKSALSNLGVELDHLVIGDRNSVEVGKKLTEDIIIIYVKDDISRVKLKYMHGKRMESVIGVSEESQSYDIIYKKDF